MSFPISAVSLPAGQAFFLLPVEPKPPVPGGAGLSSASSRGAEAARAPLGLIQLRRLLHRQGAHRHNHELGYPFSRLDLIGLGSQVAQAHTDFSPVVAVDNPDPIGQRNPMLYPQSAAGEYESGIAAARQADGDPGWGS